MKAKPSPENPFGCNRYRYLYERLHLIEKLGKHLDYGCYDGSILKQLYNSGVIRKGLGLDLNTEAIKDANERNSESGLTYVDFCWGQKVVELVNGIQFDSLSLLDVLEHIYHQEDLLLELRDILVSGGTLIVTVPRKNLFSFLDLGNLKFIFPKLHRLWYEWKYSKKEYYKRYVECKNGMIGDIEVNKSWHQHFTEKELCVLLKSCRFKIIDIDGSGLFLRPLSILRILLPIFPLNKILDKLIEADCCIFQSSNLFITAIRD